MKVSIELVPNFLFWVNLVFLVPFLSVIWFFFVRPYAKVFSERRRRYQQRLFQAEELDQEIFQLENEYTEAFMSKSQALDQESQEKLQELQKKFLIEKTALLKNSKKALKKLSEEIEIRLQANFEEKKKNFSKLEKISFLSSLFFLVFPLHAADEKPLFWSFFQFALFLFALRMWAWKPFSTLLQQAHEKVASKLEETKTRLLERKEKQMDLLDKQKQLTYLLLDWEKQEKEKRTEWKKLYELELEDFQKTLVLQRKTFSQSFEMDLKKAYDDQLRTFLKDLLQKKTSDKSYCEAFHKKSLDILKQNPPTWREIDYV